MNARHVLPTIIALPSSKTGKMLTGIGFCMIVTGCCLGRDAHATSPIELSLDQCARHPAAHNGYQNLVLRNSSSYPLEFDVVAAHDERVFAEVDQFGSGATRTLPLTLNPGEYRFSCYFEEHPRVDSAPVTVTGQPNPHATPGIIPVSMLDVTPATKEYSTWTTNELHTLVAESQQLESSIAGRNVVAAQQDWKIVNHHYQTLGAAYGAFGDYDDRINPSSAGLTQGVNDPDFTGIHAIERELFHPGPRWDALDNLSRNLTKDLTDLARAMPSLRIDPLDMGVRAHEITENTIEFTLTGRDDYGSHASLDTVAANLDGTREVLRCLHSVLEGRYSSEAALFSLIKATQAQVEGLANTYPGIALSAWTQGDRDKLNAALGALVEKLADIAAITDLRRRS